MRKISKYKRFIAAFLALNILTQVLMPTTAMALTSGPSQPEVQSFEPVGTTQMVDMFSGDFNYNIPLMTVPGPNGGYPINLAYHAGVGLEQEASWVGLGWNINPGAINRNMRGLPDDFWGQDKIKRTINHKPQWHYGFNLGGGHNEILGADLGLVNLNWNFGVYYNNYKGIGMTADYNVASSMLLSNTRSKLHPSLAVNYDSQSGMGLNANLSYYDKTKNGYFKYTLGVGYHSRQGTSELYFRGNRQQLQLVDVKTPNKNDNDKELVFNDVKTPGSGITFSNSSCVPNVSVPEGGFKASFNLKLGAEIFPLFRNKKLTGHLSFNHITNNDKDISYPAYGYLYSGERKNEDYAFAPTAHTNEQQNKNRALMDFNRHNDGPVNPKAPYLPVPMATYDVFSVSGQGVGMVFRPYRNDIGIYYEPRVHSDFGDINAGLDLGAGGLAKAGVTLGANFSASYSGPWLDKYNDFKEKYEFTNTIFHYNDNSTVEQDDARNRFLEPFYFKNAGDNTMTGLSENSRYSGDSPMTMAMDLAFGTSVSMEPRINNNNKLFANKRTSNEVRAHSVQYKTRNEMSKSTATNPANPAIDYVDQLYAMNEFPGITAITTGTDKTLDYEEDANHLRKKHHLGEFSVINPDGNKYVYGLPAYNYVQKDVFFAGNNETSSGVTDPNELFTQYGTTTDASLNNNQGEDNLYSATETPPYTYAYMLTAIYSPDYVDLTGNGPSEDDLGYYVKFNYSHLGEGESRFKWRAPLTGANHVENSMSHDGDDRGSYSYGEKEIYYLNSIETKTHIAVFKLSPRKDGVGVDNEGNDTPHANYSSGDFNGGLLLQKLDQVDLYAKSDPDHIPLKSVHFVYDYSLCKGVPNNVDNTSTLDSGKLTLTSLYFTYRGNDKGQSSPYAFTYNNTYNYNYKSGQSDCWGNYKTDKHIPGSGKNYYNADFPYVDQYAPTANDNAKAWNLSSIQLPSGGTININYESDDYRFVQNKQAMQLFEITGTGYANGGNYIKTNDYTLKEPYSSTGELPQLIFFKLKRDANNNVIPASGRYIDGIADLYFKAMLDIKKRPGSASNPMAKDYVEGYCKIDQSFGCHNYGTSGEACIRVEFVKVRKPSSSDEGRTHPFRKAAFEYLKLQRPDLLFPTSGSSNTSGTLSQIGASVIGVVRSLGELVMGFYVFCRTMGYAGQISHDSGDKPSYVRLNVPDGIKYGGGHRVAKITMNDNWSAMGAAGAASADYGMEYFYRLADGTSSGVAEYEPLIGGEENPLHLPSERYAANLSFLSKQKELYQEFPICEAYYPAANVGYSRVVSRSLTRTGSGGSVIDVNSRTAGGITVNEYYTAKDFPVKEDYSAIDNPQFRLNIGIPLVGTYAVQNHGYSQGYSVTLNDMHGKQKAVSVYAHNALLASNGIYAPVNNAQPQHKIEYKYLSSGNNVTNTVQAMTGDGQYSNQEIGVNRDFFMDFDQDRNFATSAGISADVDLAPPFGIPFWISGPWPSFNYAYNLSRTFVNMKVIQRNGILSETTVTTDKSVVKTTHLMYDAYSGRPVLTKVNNDFDKPVYNYDIAAQWPYPQMGNNAKNYRFTYRLDPAGVSTPGGFTELHPPFDNGEINIGDQVQLFSIARPDETFVLAWVKEKMGLDKVALVLEDGSPFVLLASDDPKRDAFRIINPINQNLLNVNAGNIVSLSNPVTGATNNNFWSALSTAAHVQTGSFPVFTEPASFSYTDCMHPEGPLTINFGHDGKDLVVGNSTCGFFTVHTGDLIGVNDLDEYNYSYNGSAVVVSHVSGSPTYTCTAPGLSSFSCINKCLDGVLQASSATFTNDIKYDYRDAGNPMINGSTSLFTASTSTPFNPWRYGQYGIWRLDESYGYQVNRKQSTPATDVSKDGTFQLFNWFNWDNKNAINGNSAGSGGSSTARYQGNLNWVRANKVTAYSPYGYELENLNPLGVYSAALYGYNQSVVTAMGSNLTYKRLAFESFEENISATPRLNGHLQLAFTATATPVSPTNTAAHTGKKSLDIGNKTLTIGNLRTSGSVGSGEYALSSNNRFVLTFWVKGDIPAVSLSGGFATSVVTTVSKEKIDGWQRVEYEFSVSSLSTGLQTLSIASSSSNVYIDDMRLQPFNSSVKSYVYDPVTLWLVAELDERNYATFYNYDEEGSLTQVKKETKDGVFTVKTSRNNVKR